MRSNGECSPERPRNSQKLAAMTLLLAAVGRGSEIPPLLEWLTREAHHERAQGSPRRPVWVLIRAASPVIPGRRIRSRSSAAAAAAPQRHSGRAETETKGGLMSDDRDRTI